MSHPEDTELRDLVIEALEKNGTLPTIRAQLRANIFNVFETEQVTKNESSNVMDKIFSDNESCLSFPIIYEFLEYCGLKNTLFVYKSESRHGKGYVYEGKEKVVHKLNSELKPNNTDEPILCQLIKKILRNSSDSKDDTNTYKRYVLDHSDIINDDRVSYGNEDVPPLITFDTPEKNSETNKKDEENCTYIVHDDTASFGSCAYSQSDHSPDRHKLQLKLHLEQSETDTSSTDSNRDKSSSDEYIPSDNIPPGLVLNESHTRGFCSQTFSNEILMQSPISGSSVPLANGTILKSDNKHLTKESFNDKYASKTFNSTSYMHIKIEPKVRQESVIKVVPSIENIPRSTPSRQSSDIETKPSNSYSDYNNAMTKSNNSLLQSSHLTPYENTSKYITDRSQSNNTFQSLKSQHRCVESEHSENKILRNISPPTAISKQKLDKDSLQSSNLKLQNIFANENPARTSIDSKITAPEYTTNLNLESARSKVDSIDSVNHRSNPNSDSDSIQEEINITNNNSETEESPRDFDSRSSISISDITELIESSRIDSPVEEKTSSRKKKNSYYSSKPHIEKSTNLFDEKNFTIDDSPFKELPTNKNITLRSCSNLEENEKAKFSTNSNDVDTYSDSFSQTISNITTENMEWKSESI